MLCARTVRRQKAAKAALVREGVTARVPIGRNWIPRRVTRDIRTTGRRRGVLIRAIERFYARHPGSTMRIAIATAFVYLQLASNPAKPMRMRQSPSGAAPSVRTRAPGTRSLRILVLAPRFDHAILPG